MATAIIERRGLREFYDMANGYRIGAMKSHFM